jgi:hypothetical protein
MEDDPTLSRADSKSARATRSERISRPSVCGSRVQRPGTPRWIGLSPVEIARSTAEGSRYCWPPPGEKKRPEKDNRWVSPKHQIENGDGTTGPTTHDPPMDLGRVQSHPAPATGGLAGCIRVLSTKSAYEDGPRSCQDTQQYLKARDKSGTRSRGKVKGGPGAKG